MNTSLLCRVGIAVGAVMFLGGFFFNVLAMAVVGRKDGTAFWLFQEISMYCLAGTIGIATVAATWIALKYAITGKGPF